MIEVLAMSAAYLAGVPARRLAVLAAVLWAPLALAPLMAVLLIRSRHHFEDRPPIFCDAVAAELRAGRTLGHALAAAAASVQIDAAGPEAVPVPGEVARAVAGELPGMGAELIATVEAASRSGARAADLFDELASVAIARSEIAHEVRVASAPARATAWFFVLAPTAFVVVRLSGGELDALLDSPAQRMTAAAGAALFLLGLTGVLLLVWRAR